MPAGKLGLVKDVNRANAQGIEVTFNSECVRPRLELWEDVLNAFLLPRYGANLRLKFDNPVPSDRSQTHKEAMEQLDRGAMTINEYRALQGRTPVTWGDEPYTPPTQQNAAPAWGLAPQFPPELEPQVRSALEQAWPRLEGGLPGGRGPRWPGSWPSGPRPWRACCPRASARRGAPPWFGS